MALLSADDKLRIEEAIRDLEQRTAGEVVVAVLERSSSYALVRAAAALLWATALALLAHRFWPELSAAYLLAPLPLAWAALYQLWGVPPLLRLLLLRRQVDEATLAKAFELFSRQGVYLTRGNTGLLILISELEHRVVILGDRGLDVEVHAEGWQRYVNELTQAVRAGRAAQGVLAVVESIGALLAEKYPRRPDDTNELSNHVIEA